MTTWSLQTSLFPAPPQEARAACTQMTTWSLQTSLFPVHYVGMPIMPSSSCSTSATQEDLLPCHPDPAAAHTRTEYAASSRIMESAYPILPHVTSLLMAEHWSFLVNLLKTALACANASRSDSEKFSRIISGRRHAQAQNCVPSCKNHTWP